MTTLLLILLAGVGPDGPHYDDGFSCLPLSGGTVTGATTFSAELTCADGLECTGNFDNTGAADGVILDNNGVVGGQKLTDVAPQGLLLRPQPAFAGGTQTASRLVLAGGQDETLCAIDGADPTVTCAGDNDTITVTVYNSNGASTATVLTEGTDWTASASVADTCASLATAVAALAGVGASCTSPNVRFTIDTDTAQVVLAESTAGCTTVGTGTRGPVILGDWLVNIGDTDFDTGYRPLGEDSFGIYANNNLMMYTAAGASLFIGGGAGSGTYFASGGTIEITSGGAISNVAANTSLNLNDNIQQTGITAQAAATITVEAVTTFVATRNVLTLECTGAESVATITRPSGVSGSGLLILHHGDTDCTLTDTDDGAADTIDLDEVDVAAALNVGADDRTVMLSHDGTLWRQVGKIVTN